MFAVRVQCLIVQCFIQLCVVFNIALCVFFYSFLCVVFMCVFNCVLCVFFYFAVIVCVCGVCLQCMCFNLAVFVNVWCICCLCVQCLMMPCVCCRQRKDELEQRMSSLQESRRELMVQLEGLMKLLKVTQNKHLHSEGVYCNVCATGGRHTLKCSQSELLSVLTHFSFHRFSFLLITDYLFILCFSRLLFFFSLCFSHSFVFLCILSVLCRMRNRDKL